MAVSYMYHCGHVICCSRELLETLAVLADQEILAGVPVSCLSVISIEDFYLCSFYSSEFEHSKVAWLQCILFP